jgi:hypothetical protein
LNALVAGAAAHVVEEPETAVATSTAGSPVAATQAPVSLAGISPASILALQRRAGNTAARRLVAARAATRSLQRCGSDCHCTTCSAPSKVEDDEAILEDGGQLLREAVAERSLLRQAKAKSVAKGGRCEPQRTISGTVFVSYEDQDMTAARTMLDGSRQALAKQNINLDFDVKPFLELDNLVIENSKGERTVDSYDQVCTLMTELEQRRTKSGAVVLVVPISGAMCSGDGEACYIENFRWNHCSWLKNTIRLIIVGSFTPKALLPTVLAHELGHHAGRSTSTDPNYYGHEPYDNSNYMGPPDKVTGTRDHYRSELLDRMCRVSFQF